MKRIVRLTESDLARIVKRVIMEQPKDKTHSATHSAMAHLKTELEPYGFKFSKLGDGIMDLSKGDDCNGAIINYISNEQGMKYYLAIVENCKTIKTKEYPVKAPDYLIDHKQILKDLGNYKTYKFKKTPYIG